MQRIMKPFSRPRPSHAGRDRQVGGDNLRGVFASKNAPLIYANMPKAGCTTIKNLIYYIDNGAYFADPLAIHKQETGLIKSAGNGSGENLRDYIARRRISFTFVRHPGRRAFSCFVEKIYYKGPYSFGRIRDYVAETSGIAIGDSGEAVVLEEFQRQYCAYLDFVKSNIAGNTSVRKDAHWAPQSHIIAQWRRKGVPLEFIGKLEHFESGMRYVLDVCDYGPRIDLNIQFNEGPKAPFSYDQVVDGFVEQRIEEIYGDDFRELAYTAR